MSNKQNDKLYSSYQYYIDLKKNDCENFKGEVFPSNTKDSIKFQTFDDFILKMDLYMDKHGPQSFQDKRSLTEISTKSKFTLSNIDAMDANEFGLNIQELYHLYIFSRRNTEWQGALYIHDELKLEFSTIIDLTNFFANF